VLAHINHLQMRQTRLQAACAHCRVLCPACVRLRQRSGQNAQHQASAQIQPVQKRQGLPSVAVCRAGWLQQASRLTLGKTGRKAKPQWKSFAWQTVCCISNACLPTSVRESLLRRLQGRQVTIILKIHQRAVPDDLLQIQGSSAPRAYFQRQHQRESRIGMTTGCE